MSPIALQNDATNTTLNAKAATFEPTAQVPIDNYHSASSTAAIATESAYAAHNYHPLPIVFARAQGCEVWDPEGLYHLLQYVYVLF